MVKGEPTRSHFIFIYVFGRGIYIVFIWGRGVQRCFSGKNRWFFVGFNAERLIAGTFLVVSLFLLVFQVGWGQSRGGSPSDFPWPPISPNLQTFHPTFLGGSQQGIHLCFRRDSKRFVPQNLGCSWLGGTGEPRFIPVLDLSQQQVLGRTLPWARLDIP